MEGLCLELWLLRAERDLTKALKSTTGILLACVLVFNLVADMVSRMLRMQSSTIQSSLKE